MNKKITYTLIIGILIISISVAYYFTIFMTTQELKRTEQEKQSFLFEKQTECKKVCQSIYENDKKSLPNSSILDPQYVYNENRNACFYSGGSINTSLDVFIRQIVNCQTNEKVLTFVTVGDKVSPAYCTTCVNSSKEYEAKKIEFMNNN